jgi:DNA-binding NarL/FixJ family response regulator
VLPEAFLASSPNKEPSNLAIRILVADDFAPWPRFISSIIVKHIDWHIVGEAVDGIETVQKAEELKPDLILLDIGLPRLNGIEAARQLRELAPNSKILFLSGLHDPDIVREALRTGVSGYVDKSDVRGELTKAIETTLRGEQFVSSSARGRIPEDADDSLTSTGLSVTRSSKRCRRHERWK